MSWEPKRWRDKNNLPKGMRLYETWFPERDDGIFPSDVDASLHRKTNGRVLLLEFKPPRRGVLIRGEWKYGENLLETGQELLFMDMSLMRHPRGGDQQVWLSRTLGLSFGYATSSSPTGKSTSPSSGTERGTTLSPPP